MTVSFTLPEGVEAQLRQQLGNLDQAAKEAALVELYRQGLLSHGSLAESIGISRYETDALLNRHNVKEYLLTVDELDEQVAAIRKKLGE